LQAADLQSTRCDGLGPAGADLRDRRFYYIAVTLARSLPIRGNWYVDGTVILKFDPTQAAGGLSNQEALRIGNHCNPNYFSFFHGIIDEVGICNGALSANEIQTLYQKQ
jgi:hypothetical protein